MLAAVCSISLAGCHARSDALSLLSQGPPRLTSLLTCTCLASTRFLLTLKHQANQASHTTTPKHLNRLRRSDAHCHVIPHFLSRLRLGPASNTRLICRSGTSQKFASHPLDVLSTPRRSLPRHPTLPVTPPLSPRLKHLPDTRRLTPDEAGISPFCSDLNRLSRFDNRCHVIPHFLSRLRLGPASNTRLICRSGTSQKFASAQFM